MKNLGITYNWMTNDDHIIDTEGLVSVQIFTNCYSGGSFGGELSCECQKPQIEDEFLRPVSVRIGGGYQRFTAPL